MEEREETEWRGEGGGRRERWKRVKQCYESKDSCTFLGNDTKIRKY